MKLSTKLKKAACFFVPFGTCAFGCLVIDSGMFDGMYATTSLVCAMTIMCGLVALFSPVIAMEIKDEL